MPLEHANCIHEQISSAAQSDKPGAPAFTQAGSEEVKDYFIFEEGVVVGWAITEGMFVMSGSTPATRTIQACKEGDPKCRSIRF